MENVVYAGVFGWQQILIILVVVLVLFGGRKLPELMKGMGKGIRGFKEEMNGTAEESKEKSEE